MSRRPTGAVVRDVSKKAASGSFAEGSHWNMFSRPSTTVPPSPFTGAAHRFGEDVHLLGPQGAVGLRDRSTPNIGPGNDFCEVGLHHRDDAKAVGQRDAAILTCGRDGEHVAFETPDPAAHP